MDVMDKGASWHRRPVLAPFLYALGSVVMGGVSYVFALALTDNRRTATGWLLIMDGALTLYLTACALSARKGEK
jgi:hypothetical protein